MGSYRMQWIRTRTSGCIHFSVPIENICEPVSDGETFLLLLKITMTVVVIRVPVMPLSALMLYDKWHLMLEK